MLGTVQAWFCLLMKALLSVTFFPWLEDQISVNIISSAKLQGSEFQIIVKLSKISQNFRNRIFIQFVFF